MEARGVVSCRGIAAANAVWIKGRENTRPEANM